MQSSGRVSGFVDGLVSVQFEISEPAGVMYMSMSGPADRWFGVGLNNTSPGEDAMNNTYAIIVLPDGDNNVQEWILGNTGDKKTQKVLSSSINIISKKSVGGVQTISFSRNLIGSTPDHKNFTSVDGSFNKMTMIQATGVGKVFTYHKDRQIYSMNTSSVTRGRININSEIDFTLDLYDSNLTGTPDEVTAVLSGPSSVSYSISFGAPNTHSFKVLADGTIQELYGASSLTSIITNIKMNVVGDIRTVSFNRPAKGPTSEYLYFDISNVLIDYNITTDGMHATGGKAVVSSVQQTSGSQNDLSLAVVLVDIELSEISNMMTLTLTGPSGDDTYFAVGFNATQMSTEPWTVVVIGDTVSEYHTFYNNTGPGVSQIPQHDSTVGMKLISSIIVNGMKTVKISRPAMNVIFNNNSFDFTAGYNTIPYISSHGPVTDGKLQYHSKRKTASITLSPLLSFAATADYTTSNGDLLLQLKIDENNNNVTITLQGPSDKWFGIGFGSPSMKNTYAVVVHEGIVEERLLGNHTPGSVTVYQSITISSDESTNGTRKVTMFRPLKADGQHFDFNIQSPLYGSESGIVTIAAVGDTVELASHGPNGFVYGDWLSLTTEDPLPTPTPSPMTPTVAPVTPTVAPVTSSPSGSGCLQSHVKINPNMAETYACQMRLTSTVSFHWKYNRNSKVVDFAIRKQAPGWMGVTVAKHCDLMVPAEGVIGTYETQNTYLVQSKGNNAIVVDPSQIVSNLTGSLVDGVTTIRWSRKVSNNPVIDPNNNVCFNYATHAGSVIGYHGGGPEARGSFEVNLATGSAGASTSKLRSKRVAHGVLMIMAWSWFIPLGILLKRFGKPVFSLGISQFYGHIALVMAGLVLTIASCILATSSGFGGGRYSHGTVGVAVMVLACSNPLVGICGYVFVRDPKHPQRWIFNIVHWVIGRSVYILATIQIFFGIETINSVEGLSRTPYLFAVIAGLVTSVGTFFICESLCRRANENKNVQEVSSELLK